MGFPEQWCSLALRENGNDIILASSWIVDNLDMLSQFTELQEQEEKEREALRIQTERKQDDMRRDSESRSRIESNATTTTTSSNSNEDDRLSSIAHDATNTYDEAILRAEENLLRRICR